jgi:hypothetical protein
MLVNDPSRLVASWHFVEQVSPDESGEDRVSFGLFSDNDPKTPVMAATPAGGLITRYDTYAQYLKEYQYEVENNLFDVPPIEDLP